MSSIKPFIGRRLALSPLDAYTLGPAFAASPKIGLQSEIPRPARPLTSITSVTRKTPKNHILLNRRSFQTSSTMSANMRAVLIKNGQGTADDLYIGEEPVPEPKAGEVQVKVRSPSWIRE